jgi:serine protein kinase
VKRLEEYGGDIRKFRVVKRYPVGAQADRGVQDRAGDENNQDISSLVGKVDIRKLETYAQDDPDAYSYAGGLCWPTRACSSSSRCSRRRSRCCIPLLTPPRKATSRARKASARSRSTASSSRTATRASGSLPQQQEQRGLPRSCLHRQGAVLPARREEIKIYEKLIRHSSLAEATCAPGTLKMMAQFACSRA